MNKKMVSFLALACVAAILSGCDEDYYHRAYEQAHESAQRTAENDFSSEKAKNAQEKNGDDGKKGGLFGSLGVLSPEEIGDKISDLFGISEESDPGEPSGGYHKIGNSEDQSPFDRAFSENSISGELTAVELVRMVDGDTIIVCLDGSYSYVRLIGINTPEGVAPDSYLKKTGKENSQKEKDASTHAEEFLAGVETVWLEFDEQEYDPYGRILAYVWLSTDRTEITNMLNARILADGYAILMSITPNIRYADELSNLVDDVQ